MLEVRLLKKESFLFILIKVFIALLFAIALFPGNIKSVLIFLFAITVFFYAYKKGFKIRNKPLIVINSMVYITIIITLFYCKNFTSAFYTLQTMSSLIVFPILFSFLSKEDFQSLFKNIVFYLFIYVCSILIYNLIPFLWFYITHYSYQDIVKHYPMIIIADIGRFGIHPIYMSIHCIIAIFFSFFLFKKINRNTHKLLLILANLLFIYFLIIYSKKGPIIAAFLTVLISSFLLNRKIRLVAFLSVFFSLVFVFTFPKTKSKFQELIQIEEANSSSSSSTNIRFSIYKTSLKLINNSLFLGYSIGDYNDELRNEYKKHTPFLLEKQYNSHNQYFSFLLIGGIPLLLFFLLFYYFNYHQSLKYNNLILFVLLTFYGLVMFSENILERESGVLFFSFFINFFALKNYNNVN